MQESNVLKSELFQKYHLNFHTLSSYISATYNPEVMANLDFAAVRDSLSDGQTASKLWVADVLNQFLDIKTKSVGVFGGWVGILCRFLYDYVGVKSVDNIEIDGTLEKVNQIVMGPFAQYSKFIHADMYDFDYVQNVYDVYVNTSGEHIPSLKDWIEKIPEGKIVIIQSNDFTSHPQHINCVENVLELEEKILEAKNVKNTVYRGTMQLPIYKRFMVVVLT